MCPGKQWIPRAKYSLLRAVTYCHKYKLRKTPRNISTCGETGIRTPGTFYSTSDFKSGAIVHSATSPNCWTIRVRSENSRTKICCVTNYTMVQLSICFDNNVILLKIITEFHNAITFYKSKTICPSEKYFI